MNAQPNIQPFQNKHRRSGVFWIAGAVLFIALCGGLTAPGGVRPARAQGTTPTFTPPTPSTCMYIQYAYVTETSVVVGVNNNTGSTTRLSRATLDWPSGLGGSGGDYVDYFRFGGAQFYNGNATVPPTSRNVSNSATYQITPGQTRDFTAAFGAVPLNRPLYGSFTATLNFRNGCSVSITVTREPPPSDCATVINAYLSGTSIYYVVYNNLGASTYFQSADLDWPDIPSPNRYVNYFRWGTDQFYGVNDYSPPTFATDPTPDYFAAGQTSFFMVNFGNAGTLEGDFKVSLNFSSCSTTHTFSRWVTVTPTPTATPTVTATTIPLAGASTVQFAALLLNAHDFGLDAQTIRGRVLGGGGPPYTVVISVEDPDGTIATYNQNVELDGTFELIPSETGNDNFGCDKEGIWETWFVVTDSVGGTATSSITSWAVNFPRSHGIP
ncbi:MAG: hypothetical protein JW748_06515 [Anaerolineales bacterium]|nr:hypothetical protein [Anaerolineales bacterium]